MNKMILKTLKAVKARGFDINRETLDNVDYCISLIADAEAPKAPKAPKDTGDTGEIKEVKESGTAKEADSSPVKLTKEELEDMKYWDIRKKYNITGEKSMKKDELIEMILAQ